MKGNTSKKMPWPSTRKEGAASAAAAAAGMLCLSLLLSGRASVATGLEGGSFDEGSSSFPAIGGEDRHSFSSQRDENAEGIDENGEMTPEQQAKMHMDWDTIIGKTRSRLENQIVKGERADQALRYTMGPVSLPRYCLPMGGGCSRHTPAAVSGHGGAPTVPDQIFASPQVIPGSNVLVDPQDAMERVRLGEEDVMERRLRREDRKLEELRRILTDRQRALAEGKKKKTVDDVLWDGINVHVTPADLAPKSAKQRKWEEYLWREWDRDNERFPRGSLDGMLRATREVAAARRADPEAADRAEQAEIGEVDGGKRAMYWERDDSLHYHDLGPDGKPITEEEMLQAQKASEPAGSSSRGRGAAIRAGAKKPGPGRGVPRRKRGGFDPMCQFCGGGKGGQEKDEVTEQGAEIHGQKIFTRDDWEAVKRGKDFETTFPDSDDLRTLDWLGGEKEKPYTKEEDSMSAQGIHLLLPKDWADFSKAKGTYTHYGIGPLP